MNKHQQRSEETQNRILVAAAACFAQSGYDGASVIEICQAAGVSKGAFYHHFHSKQAVFLQLLNRWLSGLDDQLSLLGGETRDVPERLMAMAGIVGPMLLVPDQELLIYLEFVNKAARDPVIWQSAVEPYHRYRDFFAALFGAGIAEGSLRPVDPKTASTILIALAIGLLVQGFLDPEGRDWQSVAQQGLGILLEGLKRK